MRSTALLGGASVFSIGIGIVRTKLFAVWLGPTGMGLVGTFVSIVDLVTSIAGLGINKSGVRQIAEVVGRDGPSREAALVATVLRRTSLGLAIAGAVFTLAMASRIATLTFGHSGQAAAVALLAVAIACKLVVDGQAALLQGSRRLGDLARIGVYGAASSTLIGVPLVYLLRERGIALFVVVSTAVTLVVSWCYSRRSSIAALHVRWDEYRRESASLLRLGMAFMVSGLLTTGAAYAWRVILLRLEGLEAAGLFQAAWTLGGMYVGLILQSMGADFYPRLVAACRDDAACNRLVNEQIQISLLLAIPGVLATLVLAPEALRLLYDPTFGAAAPTLRWVCLGMALRTLTWPIGYIVIAKSDQRLFILVELSWTIVNLALTWVLVRRFGVVGAGVAFLASYVFHAGLVYPCGRQLTRFRLTRRTLRLALVMSAFLTAAFVVSTRGRSGWSLATGLAILSGSVLYAARTLVALVDRTAGTTTAFGPLRRLLTRSGGHVS